MPEIGIICDRDEEKEEILTTIEMLAAREGFDFSAHIHPISTERRMEVACVLLAWRDRDAAFRYAEKLWNRQQSLAVIYVAYKVEDIVAALGMPFFHIVRSYGLEQDLVAAFRKLERARLPAAGKIGFTRNGQPMFVPLREIFYLESEHHEIRLHLKTEICMIKESLSQCEERLKGKGFVRTYRSFLVNMYHIRCLEKDAVALDNGERLFVSRRRYPEVKLLFENYIRHLDFIQHND